MAETMSVKHVGNVKPHIEENVYKIYSFEGKKDVAMNKERSGTQSAAIQVKGKRGVSPDVENKENRTNGEVSW